MKVLNPPKDHPALKKLVCYWPSCGACPFSVGFGSGSDYHRLITFSSLTSKALQPRKNKNSKVGSGSSRLVVNHQNFKIQIKINTLPGNSLDA